MQDKLVRGNKAFKGINVIDNLYYDSTLITATADELNILDGVTADSGELNLLDGVTADTSELNKLDGVTATTEEINELDLSSVGAVNKYKVISITVDTADDDSEQDSGESLPEDAIVKNVFLNVTSEATGTTKTLDVGTLSSGSGDADGYLVGVDISSTGIKQGAINIDDVDGSATTLGALLVDTNTTNDTAVRKNHIYGTDNISYTAGHTDVDGLEADIIIEYIEVA